MSSLCYQVKQIPDLSLHKYQSIADSGISGLLKRHEDFLRLWHGICCDLSISLHLFYVFIPEKNVGERLKLYLMLQGIEEELKMVDPLLRCSPLSDFYAFSFSNLPNINFNSGATLIKKEVLTDILNPLTGDLEKIHFVPKWEINEKTRLYDLFKMMPTISQNTNLNKPCAFRVDLYPIIKTQDTKINFEPILKKLRGENDIIITNGITGVKGNEDAKSICREYSDWLDSLETTPHFGVNLYSFSDNWFSSKVILNCVASESINKGDYYICPIGEDAEGNFNLYSRLKNGYAEHCRYPVETYSRSWPTTFLLQEAAVFFRLPVLFDGESIEIPKETSHIQITNGIYLGKDLYEYPVNFSIEDLTKHAFLTGMPGSGKTNSMLHLITELKKNEIPFLVLEPAKKEYRNILGHVDMGDVYLFSPHLSTRFPLHMNPLEFPKNVRVNDHINSLLSVFEGTFSLQGPTYKFLSDSIQKAYEDYGWSLEDINKNSTNSFPTLQDVYDNIIGAINDSSYNSEIKGNVNAFLKVRLGGLMERDAGELFNTSVSTISPSEWLDISAIVELEMLSEQSKNFFVLLVCNYILETLKSDPNGGLDSNNKKRKVRHTVFIEEAHNIIASSSQQINNESIDPKVSATAFIVKMLAEVRAMRESIVIADQLPTALAHEVVKNTGLKLVHRLVAQDDRDEIGGTISATPLQLEKMASFSKGRALIHHEQLKKPFELQVAEWNHPSIPFDITDDEQLFMYLSNNKTISRLIRSSLKVWEEKEKIFDRQVNDAINEFNNLEFDAKLLKKKQCNNSLKKTLGKCHQLQKSFDNFSRMLMKTNIKDEEIISTYKIINRIFKIHEQNICDCIKEGE